MQLEALVIGLRHLADAAPVVRQLMTLRKCAPSMWISTPVPPAGAGNAERNERIADMKFPTVLLWINAAFFLLFGALFLVAPGVFAELLTGAAPATTNALIDIRATYGGMALGIGLFFAFCARQQASVRIGLIASLLVAAGIVFGR